MNNDGSLKTAIIIVFIDLLQLLHTSTAKLLAATCAVVKLLDVPHLAIGSRVHDEVAHVWTGYR